MRDAYWDVVKGLGVLAVLLGHTGMVLTPYVYFYHVPLFFFVAGYFFKERYAAEPFSYAGSRLQRLWWPTVKYTVAFALLHNVFLMSGLYTAVEGLPRQMVALSSVNHYLSLPEQAAFIFQSITLLGMEEMCGALWFIAPMMIGLFILCGLLHVLGRRSGKPGWQLLLLAAACGLCLLGFILRANNIGMPYSFSYALICMVPVVLGWLYHCYGSALPHRWLVPVLGAVSIPLIIELLGKRFGLGPGWLALECMLLMLAGIAVHLGISAVLAKQRLIRTALAYIGRHSLCIIALHFLAYKAVTCGLLLKRGLPMDYLAAFPCLCFPVAYPLDFTHGVLWLNQLLLQGTAYPVLIGYSWIAYVAAGIALPLMANCLWNRLQHLLAGLANQSTANTEELQTPKPSFSHRGTKRIEWIDNFKFIACLGVMGSHFLYAFFNPTIYGQPDSGLLSIAVNGNFWVCVFCCLSGFFIGRKPICSLADLLRAFLLRYLRFLLPLSATAMVIFLIANTVGFNLQYYGAELNNPWLAGYYARQIVFQDYLKTIFCFSDVIDGPLWMLAALFAGNLLLYVCSYLAYTFGVGQRVFALPMLTGLLVLSVFYDVRALYAACCVFGSLLPGMQRYLSSIPRWLGLMGFIVWLGIFAYHCRLVITTPYQNAAYACLLQCILFSLMKNYRSGGLWRLLTPLSLNVYLWHWPLFCGLALPLYGWCGGGAIGQYAAMLFTVIGVILLALLHKHTTEPFLDNIYLRIKKYIA